MTTYGLLINGEIFVPPIVITTFQEIELWESIVSNAIPQDTVDTIYLGGDWLTENLPLTAPPLIERPGAEYGADVL